MIDDDKTNNRKELKNKKEREDKCYALLTAWLLSRGSNGIGL